MARACVPASDSSVESSVHEPATNVRATAPTTSVRPIEFRIVLPRRRPRRRRTSRQGTVAPAITSRRHPSGLPTGSEFLLEVGSDAGLVLAHLHLGGDSEIALRPSTRLQMQVSDEAIRKAQLLQANLAPEQLEDCITDHYPPGPRSSPGDAIVIGTRDTDQPHDADLTIDDDAAGGQLRCNYCEQDWDFTAVKAGEQMRKALHRGWATAPDGKVRLRHGRI